MKNQTEFEKALTTLIFNREGYIHLLGRPEEEYESDLEWIQTLDIAIDAMQKQKQKLVITNSYEFYWECPICGKSLDYNMKYCFECGQRLDWSNSK